MRYTHWYAHHLHVGPRGMYVNWSRCVHSPPPPLCARAAYGGLVCEGALRALPVSSYGHREAGVVQPGEWTYFIFQIDPRRFNFRCGACTCVASSWVHDSLQGNGDVGVGRYSV
jgi:hypothetical protein